ncbi:MAG: NADH-quinone oxidoreductase subunit N [Gemmatimonadales bacterium]|nr:MAG: NADH-quinone oxidoreductase subunit N [Gemmatimonadales bacterium]
MIIDFSSQIHYVWALLPEIILAATGLTILTVDVFLRGSRSGPSGRWVPAAAVLGTVTAGAAAVFQLGFESPLAMSMVAIDEFRVALTLVILAATTLSILFGMDYLERRGLAVGEYYFLILMAAIGMTLLTAARDLIVVFVAIELMSISVYVLAGFDRSDVRSAEAALKYFLMGAFASAFLLYGIAMVYGASGSTNLSIVGSEIAAGTASGNALLYGGVALLVIGFAFKISAVPFHMWTPDVYQGAPPPVTGFMAAGVKAAAFASLLRVVAVGLAPAEPAWHGIVWWLAVLTMVVPNLIALQEDDVKRMLAYSSVAHAGYLMVGLIAGSALGYSASVFYLGVYAVMTLGAFAVVSVVGDDPGSSASIGRFRGLGWSRPFLAGMMVVCLLSLAGFPPTGGFIGKLYLLRAAMAAGEAPLAVLLVLTSLISYYYYLRVIWKMYFEETPEGATLPPAPGRGFRIAAVLTVLTILVAGIWPGPAVDATDAAGASIFHVETVVGTERPPLQSSESGGPTAR